MLRHRILLSASLLLFAGCDSAGPAGTFVYSCDGGETDAACTGAQSVFPPSPVIAVGSHFTFDYQPKVAVPGGVTITPASPELVDDTGLALRAGTVAMIATQTAAPHDAVDFFHVTLEDVVAIQPDATSVTARIGADRTVVLTPVDGAGHALAGVLVYGATSDDENVATVSTSGRRVFVHPAALGKTVVRLTAAFSAAPPAAFAVEVTS